jgi:RimJ/RimL family protein N-acetyltransferase
MNIQKIDQTNLYLLNNLIRDSNISSSFRYYKNRQVDIIKNHLITLIGLDDYKTPVSYGHIDKENDTYWIGLFVLIPHQKKGYGTIMLHNLLAYARINKINLQLSVDSNNIIAKKLYLSCGFYNVKDNETYTIMMTKTKFEMILQVSSGEAYDKLSILDIKIDKIKDDDK